MSTGRFVSGRSQVHYLTFDPGLSSKAIKPNLIKFHIGPPGVEKICSNDPSNMANMATTPIYG